MKPFDLEKAKAGAKVITRDGKAARIVCFDRKDRDHPILALVPETPQHERLLTLTLEGSWHLDGAPSRLDLFMAPEITTYYVPLIRNKDTDHIFTVGAFKTPEDAEKQVRSASATYEIVTILEHTIEE